MNLENYYYGLSSEQLSLRKLIHGDINSWIAFYKNNPNLKYLNIDLNRSPFEMSKAWIETQMKRYENNKFGQLGITSKKEGTLIGTIGCMINKKCEEGEIIMAIAIKPAFWRKGYGKEASSLVIKAVFENNLSETIVGFRHIHNYPSGKLFHQLKFEDIGVVEQEGRKTIKFQLTKGRWEHNRDPYHLQSKQIINP